MAWSLIKAKTIKYKKWVSKWSETNQSMKILSAEKPDSLILNFVFMDISEAQHRAQNE